MASANTICKKLLNVKTAVVTGNDFYTDEDGVNQCHLLKQIYMKNLKTASFYP